MSEEWIWAAAICAAPFAMFGLIEMAAALSHRRQVAVARRPKSMSPARPRRSMSRAD